MTQAHAQETLDSRLFHLKMWSKSFSLVEEYRRWCLIIVNQTYTPKMKVTNCIWFFSIMNLITPGGSINFLFFRLSLILHSRVFRRSLWLKMEVTSINGKLHVLTVENRLFGGTTHGDTIKPTIVTSVPRKYAKLSWSNSYCWFTGFVITLYLTNKRPIPFHFHTYNFSQKVKLKLIRKKYNPTKVLKYFCFDEIEIHSREMTPSTFPWCSESPDKCNFP